MTDPIADMLTRIRNASAVRKTTVRIPFSRMKAEIARVLKEEGYIVDVVRQEDGTFPVLKIGLKYSDASPAIRYVQRVSKPGCRIYSNSKELPVVLNNLGVAILSTSKGIMTNHAARKMGVGGEVLCEVY